MRPAEVFVLRIVFSRCDDDRTVHGIVETVRNDRQYVFGDLQGPVRLLEREIEAARLQHSRQEHKQVPRGSH
jgi:hypothetical protein